MKGTAECKCSLIPARGKFSEEQPGLTGLRRGRQLNPHFPPYAWTHTDNPLFSFLSSQRCSMTADSNTIVVSQCSAAPTLIPLHNSSQMHKTDLIVFCVETFIQMLCKLKKITTEITGKDHYVHHRNAVDQDTRASAPGLSRLKAVGVCTCRRSHMALLPLTQSSSWGKDFPSGS